QSAIQAEQTQVQPNFEGELRAIDDQLGQASLDQFKRTGEIQELDELDRQDVARQASIETELAAETQELASFLRQRDEVAQAGLVERSGTDLPREVRRIELERSVEESERMLRDQERNLEVLSAKLRALVDQNYDSEELRVVRAQAALAEETRNNTSAELERSRLQLRLFEQSTVEAHDWNEAQARSDLIQSYDEERRVIRQKYSALREELSSLETQLDQRRQKRAVLEEEWKASQQVIDSLVEARDRVFQRVPVPSEVPRRSGPPS
ncbi:hypothetical protein EBZ37_09910, partial [bacterium]|nr:hypothetical protein [bacterium]